MTSIQISETFERLSNSNEFLELLNQVNKVLYPNSNDLNFKNFGYYINRELKEKEGKKFYTAFKIPKKNGNFRIISAPIKPLKHFQEIINEILKSIFQPHKNAYGFVPNKSVVDNSQKHISKNFVYNIDLENFFASFSKKWIYNFLLFQFGFNTTKDRKFIALIIATLVCCTDAETGEQVLPQGAPTSPFITNMLCYKLDVRLSGLAKRFGLQYSRYADDITFSSNHNLYKKELIFVSNSIFDIELRRIITDFGLKINEKKVRLQVKGNRQEVTGLIVNSKLNVNRKYINDLRQNLFFWEKYGYNKANILFKKKYLENKSENIDIEHVLRGKLDYLKMVKGENDETYVKLKKRFINLRMPKIRDNTDLNSLIENILTNGVNNAFES